MQISMVLILSMIQKNATYYIEFFHDIFQMK